MADTRTGPEIRSLSVRSRWNLVIIVASFAVLVLACLGGSSADCVGEVTVNGKKYEGMAKNEQEAKRNSCAKYCIEGDPEMDGMYRIWLDSLSESERKRVRKGTQGKWDAVYKSDRIRSYVESCEANCLRKNGPSAKCKS